MQPRLIPCRGGDPVIIGNDLTVVGRHRKHCDVAINHNSVSKLHCVIVKTDGLLFVRDLASTNGTKVNGQRITRGALLPGDELSIAKVKFQVDLGTKGSHVSLKQRSSTPKNEKNKLTEYHIISADQQDRDDSPSDGDLELIADDSVT